MAKDKQPLKGQPSYTRVPKSMRIAASTVQKISIKKASRLAWNLFLTPYAFKIPSREIPFEARFGEAQFLKHSTGHLFPVYSIGQGPKNMVLVHGWSGRFTQFATIISTLEKLHPNLLDEFTIIGFNAVAHRGAQGKKAMMPYFAECIALIADNFGPIHTIIAHSLGANASLYANQRLQIPLERQILIAPPGLISDMVRLFCQMIGFNADVQEALINHIKQTHGDDFDLQSAPELAKSNTVPTLVFHDTEDQDTPIALGRKVGQHMANGTYVETTGLGHRRILHDPSTAKQIAEFIFNSNQ
ncbi:MAG: hypothetical protein RL754_277 [Bacteroidota bacterium]